MSIVPITNYPCRERSPMTWLIYWDSSRGPGDQSASEPGLFPSFVQSVYADFNPPSFKWTSWITYLRYLPRPSTVDGYLLTLPIQPVTVGTHPRHNLKRAPDNQSLSYLCVLDRYNIKPTPTSRCYYVLLKPGFRPCAEGQLWRSEFPNFEHTISGHRSIIH